MTTRQRSRTFLIFLAILLFAGFVGTVTVALWDRPPALLPSPPIVAANGLIAVSANPNTVGGGEVGDIYLVSEARPPRRIIGSDGDGVAQACPTFAPDGRRLAFGEARASDLPVTTSRGMWPVTDRAVVVVGLNEQGEASPATIRVILPKEEGEITCPKWSPNGTQVAFRVGAELWVADVGSGHTTVYPVVEAPWGQQEFEWSRDGTRIAVSEPGRIRVLRVDVGVAGLIEVEGSIPSSLAWIAADQRIVYTSTDLPGDGLAINAVDVPGGNDWQLTPDPADPQLNFRFYDTAASPDGSRVAYVQRTYRCANDGCRGEPDRVHIMDPDGSSVAGVPIPAGFGAHGLQWSPDGEQLIFGWIDGVVSVPVEPGAPAVVYSRGELNLEWSSEEVTWQPVPP